MSHDIQLIVQALNAPPFSRRLTLVAFDDLSPAELLQLANDVFAELDRAHSVDVRDEPAEQAGPRMVGFLQLLKFPLPAAGSAELEAFAAALLRGAREALYPVLGYILARLPQLKKRAYVAKYLVPTEVPDEVAHDESVAEMLAQYRELQLEFKEVHKLLDRMTAGAQGGRGGGGGGVTIAPTPQELRREMQQLEEERGQLVEKVAGLRKKTSEIRGFAPLLEATSSLRKEQEEEGKLRERMHEQRANLQAAERRYADANRRLAETRLASREDLSAEAVFEAARRDNAEARNHVRKVLPATLEARRETLQRLGRMLQAPAKSELELHELRASAAQLEHLVGALTADVTAAQRAAGDDKLAMFRQQAALMAKKLAQKEEALDSANREVEALARELEAKESKLSELSGPKFMRREEFKAYAAALRTKTATFKQLKQELGDLRQESVVLAQTEALLRSRAGDMDVFLRRLEEKKGVTGYTSVQSDLEKVSALKARIDESKGATLNEISRIVEDINRAIKDKKAKLAPAIQALRAMRQEFSDVEAGWLQEKARYESVASGLEAEKLALEREADAAQAEAHGEDSRRAMLGAMAEAAQAQLERAREEQAYVNGEGRFLRDFRTLQDVYAHKLQQLEALAKELRKRQKDIRDNAAMHAAQRAKFVDLRRLLQAKISIYRAAFDTGGGGFGGDGKRDEGFDLGASNVLLLAAAP